MLKIVPKVPIDILKVKQNQKRLDLKTFWRVFLLLQNLFVKLRKTFKELILEFLAI